MWLKAYKISSVVMFTYVILMGLLYPLPYNAQLQQTARAVFFHVPNWIALYVMLLLNVAWSIRYLRTGGPHDDRRAAEAARVALFFGALGFATGMVWSRVTWSALLPSTDLAAWFPADPKAQMALAALLVVAAYLVLRQSVEAPRKRARLSAVYSLFSVVAVVALTYILPRTLQSLHPGSDAPNQPDTSFASDFLFILYPAFLAYILLAGWLWELRVRAAKIQATLNP